MAFCIRRNNPSGTEGKSPNDSSFVIGFRPLTGEYKCDISAEVIVDGKGTVKFLDERLLSRSWESVQKDPIYVKGVSRPFSDSPTARRSSRSIGKIMYAERSRQDTYFPVGLSRPVVSWV